MPTPETFPTTWVRTGQTASFRSGSDRCQIVGVTEVVHFRSWIVYGNTSELGDRSETSMENFLADWTPYYNTGQTRVGSRYLHRPSNRVCLVIRDESDRFLVQDEDDPHPAVLDRLGLDPDQWLYIGPPRPLPTQRRGEVVFSTTRDLRSPSHADVTPKSRFERDDIL